MSDTELNDESKENLVSFKDASDPHVHARKENKLKAMKQAFKRARVASGSKPRKKKKGSPRKKR
jgi:hypothetical protein